MTPPLPKDKPDLRKKLHDLPHRPGVYLMRDRLNRVIYVGKARDLRKRVSQYFMESKKRTADPKTRALLESVWDLEWHTVRSEPEALLLEGKLIKEFRPKYNVAFRDDKRFLMVKVDMAEEWPRFRLARFKREDNARYFGPYANAGALRQTLHFMRKRFGILTTGRGEPSERDLKSSTFQVHFKLSGLNPEHYRQKVEEACEFIAGQSRELLAELEAEMHKAAEKLDFERAAELRNMLDDLRATMAPSRRFTRFTRNTLPSTVVPEADLLALADALQLAAPPRVMECFDISNISTTHIVASMVCFRDGVPDIGSYRRYRIKTVAGQNDFASMGEVIRRRYSRILLEASITSSPRKRPRKPWSGSIAREPARCGCRTWLSWTAARGSFPAPARNCSGSGCTSNRSSAWPRSLRRFTAPDAPRRCCCRRIRARCGSCSGFATRRTGSPTATTSF